MAESYDHLQGTEMDVKDHPDHNMPTDIRSDADKQGPASYSGSGAIDSNAYKYKDGSTTTVFKQYNKSPKGGYNSSSGAVY